MYITIHTTDFTQFYYKYLYLLITGKYSPEFCTVSCAPIINPIASDISVPLDLNADALRIKASPISAEVTAKLFVIFN